VHHPDGHADDERDEDNWRNEVDLKAPKAVMVLDA
jgi:hypothetical protein